MNNNKIIIIAISLLMTILIGCSQKSDSPFTPNTTDWSKYFPTTIGSWWLTEDYLLGENSERVELVSRDSIVIIGEEVIDGRTAKVFNIINLANTDSVEIMYIYMDGAKVYEYVEIGPFTDEKSWMMTIDFASENKWTITDTNLTNVDFEEGSTFTGNLKVSAENGDDRTITIKEQSYESKAVDLSVSMEGNMSMGFKTIPMSFNMTQSEFYSEGIGKSQTLMENRIIVEGFFNQTSYSETIVVDFEIK